MSEIPVASPAGQSMASGRILTPAAGAFDQPPKRQNPNHHAGDQTAKTAATTIHSEPPVTLAATLAALEANTEISGTLVGREPGGAPVLESPAGTFSVISPTPLNVGSQIQLRVVSVGATARAMIVLVNGKPPDAPGQVQLILTQLPAATISAASVGAPSAAGVGVPSAAGVGVPSAAGVGAPSAAGEPAASPPAASLVPGTRLEATLLPAPANTASATTLASMAGPAPVHGPDVSAPPAFAVRVVAVTPPLVGAATPATPPNADSIGTASGGPGAGHGDLPVDPPAAASAKQSPGASAPGAAPHRPLVARPPDSASQGPRSPRATLQAAAQAATPDTPAAPLAAAEPRGSGLAPGRTFRAVAVAETSSGTGNQAGGAPSTLFHGDLGPMWLEIPVTVGTGVVLEILASAAPVAAASDGAAARSPVPAPGLAPAGPPGPAADVLATLLVHGRWPALEESMRIIASGGSAEGAAAMQALPAANDRLAPTLLFFLSALRAGDLSGWLGAAGLAGLEAMAAQTARRLAEEFQALGRLVQRAAEPGADEWRPIVFPFSDGDALRTLTLFVRHHRYQRGDGQEEDSTRFVVEVELSKLGPLQLDGLVRDPRFDLILRSTRRLPGSAEDEIRELFEHALAGGKLTGTLIFQTTSGFPVAPLGNYLEKNSAAAIGRITV